MNEDLESTWILRTHSYNTLSQVLHSTIAAGFKNEHGRSWPGQVGHYLDRKESTTTSAISTILTMH